jgi:hypothetical protein
MSRKPRRGGNLSTTAMAMKSRPCLKSSNYFNLWNSFFLNKSRRELRVSRTFSIRLAHSQTPLAVSCASLHKALISVIFDTKKITFHTQQKTGVCSARRPQQSGPVPKVAIPVLKCACCGSRTLVPPQPSTGLRDHPHGTTTPCCQHSLIRRSDNL